MHCEICGMHSDNSNRCEICGATREESFQHVRKVTARMGELIRKHTAFADFGDMVYSMNGGYVPSIYTDRKKVRGGKRDQAERIELVALLRAYKFKVYDGVKVA